MGFQKAAGHFYFSHVTPMCSMENSLMYPPFKAYGMWTNPSAAVTLPSTAKAAAQPLSCPPNYSTECQIQGQSVMGHLSSSLNGPVDLK